MAFDAALPLLRCNGQTPGMGRPEPSILIIVVCLIVATVVVALLGLALLDGWRWR